MVDIALYILMFYVWILIAKHVAIAYLHNYVGEYIRHSYLISLQKWWLASLFNLANLCRRLPFAWMAN